MYAKESADTLSCLDLNQITIEDILAIEDDILPFNRANMFKECSLDCINVDKSHLK